MRYLTMLLLTLLMVAPCMAVAASSATEVEVAVRSGDQSQVAISGTLVVFTDFAGGSDASKVWYYDLSTQATGLVSDSSSPQKLPAVSGQVVAYLQSWYMGGQIFQQIWMQDLGVTGAVSTLKVTYPPYVPSQLALADLGALLAWQDEGGTTLRILVLDTNSIQQVEGSGSQSSPAAAGRKVVFLSESDRAVWTYNADTTERKKVFDGPAADPHIDAEHIVFVDQSITGGDIAVITYDGTRVATLDLAGQQAAPRISGKWVAFEDLSSGVSHIAVWNWTTDVVTYPVSLDSTQSQGDLNYPWLVYVDWRNGNADVYAQELKLEDSGGGIGPARCDDLSAVPLATLTVEVVLPTDPPHHCHGTPPDPCKQLIEATNATTFSLSQATRVLVCVDANQVQEGWVTLNGLGLAGPAELGPTVDHFEVRAEAQQGDNSLAARIEGNCGATLTVRVLDDSSDSVDPSVDPSGDAGTTDDGSPKGGCGCGSGDSTGIFVLAGLALLWTRRARFSRNSRIST